MQLGDTECAAEAYRSAVAHGMPSAESLRPRFVMATFNLGLTYQQLAHWDKVTRTPNCRRQTGFGRLKEWHPQKRATNSCRASLFPPFFLLALCPLPLCFRRLPCMPK